VSNKRVLPVVVLLSGILAGAGWMAVNSVSHHEAKTAAVAHLMTTAPATSSRSVATTTSSKAKPTTSATKPKPTAKKTPPPAKKVTTKKVSSATVTNAVQSVSRRAIPGVMVLDRQSGKTLLSINSGHRFHSASLVKLLIAIDVLHSGASSAERSDLSFMLKMSDDNTASRYWVRQGGAPLVSREASRLGLHETAPPTPAGQWGNTWLSPRDMVTIYQYILSRLPGPDRDLIVNAMAAAPQHASDGFNQWFGIPSGQRADWAIKQGWGSSSDSICLHSTGLVGTHWRYIVVVMTQHPLGTSLATGTASTTAGVRALAPLIN
jgi:beta-lactamase family protein